MAPRYRWVLLMTGALALPNANHAQAPEIGDVESEPVAPIGQSRFLSFLSENTHGALEIGAVYGRPPFSLEATNALNLFSRGSLQMVLMGMPITSSFDLGSDVSTRGARNRFRVSVDTERLKELVQLRDARRLEDARVRRDSIQQAFTQAGHLDRADTAASQARMSWLSPEVSSIEVQRADVDSLMPAESGLTGGLSQSATVPIAVDTARSSSALFDRNLSELSLAEKNQERAEAIVNMDMDRSIGGRFLMGLRRLELGSLTPNGSEFLLNGISLQGVGTEWASERFFFSFDHGRCLDDSWRNASISADRLRRLQESLLLLDASALDPRRLSVLRTGVGMPESTHVHIGILQGRRSGLAYGTESPFDAQPSEMRNHVIEIDAAMAIKVNHMARVVVARSLTSVDVSETETVNEDALLGRGSMRYSATMLHWRTELPKAKTTFNLTGRAVGSGFHSMGLAFIRSGARSLDGMVSKDFGRLRLRLGFKREVRQGSLGTDQVLLDRYRLQSAYRLSRSVSLRASVLPLFVKGQEHSIGDQRVLVTQAGFNVRWRKRKTQFMVLGDFSRFSQVMLFGSMPASATWYGNAGVEVQGNRMRVALMYTGLLEPEATSPTAGAVSVECSFKLRNGVELGSGTVVDPESLGNLGGKISYMQPLYKGLYLTLAAERWQERRIFQSQDFGNEALGLYTCSALVGYSW